MKKILLILLLVCAGGFAKSQSYYLSVKISFGQKQGMQIHKFIVDCGTDAKHPLYKKFTEVPNGSVKLTTDGDNFIVFNNEIDLLNHLENNGWNLVEVNTIEILEHKHLHYLFKTE